MDMYNMSDAISQGNALSSNVDSLNESIRFNNKQRVDAAKQDAKTAVAGDKSLGIMTGIKDGAAETAALTNTANKIQAYNKSIANPGEPGGFTEEAATQADYDAKGAKMGLAPGELKPAAAITTSEGTLAEGDSILKKGAGAFEEAGNLAKAGKLVGGIAKGAGVLGGLASSGLDIAEDVKAHGIAGDNIGEKIANLGTIGGTALDMIGLIPGFQLAGVVGAGLQLASGALDAASSAVHTSSQEATDSKPAPVTETPQVAQASLAGSFTTARS
jgi:hypothetical protein|tara:strand:- start:9245 stop:10063 length:819 start_codon:yes stop_codon:yes gene_type:complete